MKGRRRPMRFKQIMLMSLVIALPPSAMVAQQAFDPLNAHEIDLARSALLANVTVREHLGRMPYYAIVNVERHVEQKDATSAGRRADVILYSYATNETISAVVGLAGNPRVDALRVTRDLPPPLGAEEVEAARRLALANAAVRSRLQAVGVADSDPSLIVTHLLGRTEDARDPCSRNRCVVLFFNTEAAFLFSAAVDLTERKVRTIDAPAR